MFKKSNSVYPRVNLALKTLTLLLFLMFHVMPEHYRCCGAEATFDLGYMVWEQNPELSRNYAVPDTCCVEPEADCGFGIFENHNLKRMSEYVKKIHVHGCLRAMEYVLQVLFVYISRDMNKPKHLSLA